MTDALADLLLTPSHDGDENLKREGVPESKIKLVGNVMIDALIANLEQVRSRDLLEKLGVTAKDFVTLHRPSNVDEQSSLTAIMSELKLLASHLSVMFPIHPRTRNVCAEFASLLKVIRASRFLTPSVITTR